MKIAALALFVSIACASTTHADVLIPLVTLESSGDSEAWIDYFDDAMHTRIVPLTCVHWIADETGNGVTARTQQVVAAHWYSFLTAPIPAGSCHRGKAAGSGPAAAQEVGSAQVCMYGPPPPPPPPPPGPIGGCETDCGSSWNPDPLVLDLNGDGVRTAGTDDMVSFDLDGDGARDHITWTDPADGFLWLNLNEKNHVDDGAELFGIGTLLPNGLRASNGFEALAAYDENHDNILDAADDIWRHLRIWVDANHDGVCQQAETSPMQVYRIDAISLTPSMSEFVDEKGNGHRLKSRYWRIVGNKRRMLDLDAVSFRGEHATR